MMFNATRNLTCNPSISSNSLLPLQVNWDRGLLGICDVDCEDIPGGEQYDKGLNAKFSPQHSDFLADVRAEKAAIGKVYAKG